MKYLAYFICYLIYPFSFLVPRDKNKIAFGSYRGAFNDNSKYLFLDAINRLPHKQIYWLSISRATVNRVRSLGLPAYWTLSPRGAWLAMRAKYWFVNCYASDIMFCLSGRAKIINLWHGVGLKCCEFNIKSGPLAKRYVDKQFIEVYTHPEVFVRPEYVIAPTPFQGVMFAQAFRLPEYKCLPLGYPRNTILTWEKECVLQFVDKYEPQNTKDLINSLLTYKKAYIYMPTWRDSQLDVFTQHFCMDELENILAEQDAIMLMKPHPNSKVSGINPTTHIHFVSGDIDVYGVLPFVDVLITDYSSILYDFLLMKDKQVILYLYDKEEYVNDREFYYPFDENVCGARAYDWESLARMIQTGQYNITDIERQSILDKFWGDTMSTDVCAEIYKRLGLCEA